MKIDGRRLNGKWAKEYDCCIECGTVETRHYAKGLCSFCYLSKRYKENPDKTKKSSLDYYYKNGNKNREKKKKYFNKFRKEHPEVMRERSRKYAKKYREKIQPRLKINVSSGVREKLKKRLLSKEGKSTWSFLPYTVDELIQHLEELFTEGMTWENYGLYGWHIDHKRPDCSFNYETVDDKEFQKCWALKNLQPLWAIDNLKKGGRWDG